MNVSKYVGMPLNKRLSSATLQNEFAQAVQAKDSPKMTDLLLQVDYTHEQVAATVKTFLADPSAYQTS